MGLPPQLLLQRSAQKNHRGSTKSLDTIPRTERVPRAPLSRHHPPFPPASRQDWMRAAEALSNPHTSSTDYGLLNPSNQRRKLETTVMITNKPMVIDPPFNCRERGWGGRVNSTCFVSPAAEIQPGAHRNPDLQKPRTEFLFC